MKKRTLFGLAGIPTAALLCASGVTAGPPPMRLNNPFPASFYGFNPGYYGPYYPGHYQYGNVQPSTYNNYRTPAFPGYGISGSVPLLSSSQLYRSPSTFGSTSSWSGSSIGSPAYRILEFSPSKPHAWEGQQTTVWIKVHVPAANAELWVEGWKTTSKGDRRQFLSPPLVPGQRYLYEVRARWFKNGRELSRTRKVPVQAGEQIIVDFTRPEPAQTKSEPMSGVETSR